MRVRRAALSVAAVLLVAAPARADDASHVATRGDAFISHGGGDIWSIGSAGIELTLAFDSSRALVPTALTNRESGRSWNLGAEPDVSVTIAGQRVILANGGPTAFTGATARATDTGVRLDFAFEHRAQRLRITRSYAAYPGAPTIETWTRIEATTNQMVAVTGLTGWQLTIPHGTVRWIGGLRGDSADTHDLGAFSFDDRNLEPGERVEIGASRRSTEDFLPFFTVQGDGDRFYGGLMWSGAWRLTFERHDESLHIDAHFPDVGHDCQPAGAARRAAHVLRRHRRPQPGRDRAVRKLHRQRHPPRTAVSTARHLQHLVSVRHANHRGRRWWPRWIARRALGVELFVLDAGWWVGAGRERPFDFDSGLGDWTDDRDRFPSSLASLADYAHGLGMKFGLWVEPERRVALHREPGRPGAGERGSPRAAAGTARAGTRRSASRAMKRASGCCEQIVALIDPGAAPTT